MIKRHLFLLGLLCLFAEVNLAENDDLGFSKEVHVGVILDMGSSMGKILCTCMSMAISDFYSINTDYKTRVVLESRDAEGESLKAFEAAFELSKKSKVGAIIVAQTSVEAKILAELGDREKVPLISFFSRDAFNSTKHPYFVQIKQNYISEVKGIAAIAEKFKWKEVIFIYEDTRDESDIFSSLSDLFQEKGIRLAYKIVIHVSSNDNQIIEELQKAMTMHKAVFIVHMSYSLVPRLFLNAQKLGMMGDGYGWIMTSKSMNELHLVDSSVINSMEGVIGFRSHIQVSKELLDFTSRWRRRAQYDNPNMEVMVPGIYGVWAYDIVWRIAQAAENIRLTYKLGPLLLEEMLQIKGKGLSGELQFINEELKTNQFEIVNLVGTGERTLGFWSSEGKLTSELHSPHDGRYLFFTAAKLESIIWPGGSTTAPKGRLLITSSNKPLRIGVPALEVLDKMGLVKIMSDPRTNDTRVSGFCIDVFIAAMEALPDHNITYEFIPFSGVYNDHNWTYDDMINQVYLKKLDAVVGDVTILANRSLYVDFTITYTDIGVGMIVKNVNNMWVFLRPLKKDLWLTTGAFFLLTGLIVWLIERPINSDFQGSTFQQIGTIFWFSFSTLVFAHRERLLSNLSKLIMIVWVFVVLILTSSYTATLASMITLQQINLASKDDYIGYKLGSKMVINNLNFQNFRMKSYQSREEFAEALTNGSEKGGVSAIIDEIQYIKSFLTKYSAGYSLVGRMSTTNGFGFVFQKGSPLVAEISREIMRLREDGKLAAIENIWFPSKPPFTTESETSNEMQAIGLDSFGGLFILTGTTSALALCLSLVFMVHNRCNLLLNFHLRYLLRKVIEVISIRMKSQSAQLARR